MQRKLVKLILLLQTPKEQVLEVIPLIVGQAIIEAFADKISDDLTKLLVKPEISIHR